MTEIKDEEGNTIAWIDWDWDEDDEIWLTVGTLKKNDDSEQTTLTFKKSEERNRWEMKSLYTAGSWSPSYHFGVVNDRHTRLIGISEHCNMIPPDWPTVDYMNTPDYPNEVFRELGMKEFETDYKWSMEEKEWVKKDE
jgi:hypothetical protein